MEILSRSITRYLLRRDAVAETISLCRLCWIKTEGGSSLDQPLIIASQVFRGTLTVKEILVKMFQKCSYDEKSLPQTICDSCLETVVQFFQFWQLCHDTEYQIVTQIERMTKQVTSLQDKVVDNPVVEKNLKSAVMFMKSEVIDIFDTEYKCKVENVLARLTMKIEESTDSLGLQSNDFDEANESPELQTNNFKCCDVKTEEVDKKLEPQSSDSKCSACQKSYLKSRAKCKLCETKLQSSNHTKNFNNSNKSQNYFVKYKEHFCDYCQKKFRLKSTLQCHISSIHLNPKSYECLECHKKVNTKGQLEAHSIVHTKVRDFQCEICGKYLITKYALAYHIRLHTGEKPHKCHVCGEGFTNASRKSAHIRRKHLGRTETCNVCSKTYHSGYPIRRHMKRHFNPNSTLFQSAVKK